MGEKHSTGDAKFTGGTSTGDKTSSESESHNNLSNKHAEMDVSGITVMADALIFNTLVDVCNGRLRVARVYKSERVRCGGVLDMHDSDVSISVTIK